MTYCIGKTRAAHAGGNARLWPGCIIGDEKSRSKKGNNSGGKKKMHFELSPLIIWIDLWIVNTYSKFEVNIVNNNRNITKCESFCMMPMTMPMTPRL